MKSKFILVIIICALLTIVLFLRNRVIESYNKMKISDCAASCALDTLNQEYWTHFWIKDNGFERQTILENHRLEDLYNQNYSESKDRLFVLSRLKQPLHYVVENFLTKFKDTPIDKACNLVKLSVADFPTKRIQTVRVEYVDPLMLNEMRESFYVTSPVLGKYVIVTSPSLSNVATSDAESLALFYEKYFPEDYVLMQKKLEEKPLKRKKYPLLTTTITFSWPPVLDYFNENETSL